ncbi:hypothetical protein [Thalassolituus hydrocarboniclasticus]|uniref:DM13 domain-containing protein n=1 Tax=Thalassolituus hydrocarboniclasticus TaxID=2742796 RepID=A0ABY6A8Y0_9GAMM|nr:hypothetical protein [Thalassolituus hydrocarboniclasticus]UXD87397.1 hypothetical protein HUF19_08110 [Thalassolituus hydrocarboniclasticus]
MPSPFTHLFRLIRSCSFCLLQSGILLLPLLNVLSVQAADSSAAVMPQAGKHADAAQVSPEWVERYLYTRNSALLDDSFNDHVMSFYFFGRVGERTLIGLERVRGDDYEQFFSLLVFEGEELLGYYRNVLSFPSGVADNGDVQFPRGVNAHLQGNELELSISASEFTGLCQRLRGAQAEQDLCVPWTSVRSQ